MTPALKLTLSLMILLLVRAYAKPTSGDDEKLPATDCDIANIALNDGPTGCQTVPGNRDATVVVAKHKPIPKLFDFAEYVRKFHKNYNPLETINKAKLFFARTIRIFQHNILYKDEETTYYLTQNQFTDATSNELEQNMFDTNSELSLVDEAHKTPDLPANEAPSVLSEIHRAGLEKDGLDGFNWAESPIKDKKPSSVQLSSDVKDDGLVLNFTKNERVSDISVFLNKIKSNPELAETASKFVESVEKLNEQESILQKRKLEQARAKSQINYVRMVRKSNPNWRPLEVESRGLLGDFYNSAKKHAELMMEDPLYFERGITEPQVRSDRAAHDRVDLVGKFFEKTRESMKLLAEDPLYFERGINEPPLKSKNPLFDQLLSRTDNGTVFDINQMISLLASYNPMGVADRQKASKRKQVSLQAKYNIDWRTTGCITPPKNQLTCNSCYAFTTLALMEYFYCRQTKNLTDFSPQYIVDCGSKVNLRGCSGGKISYTGQFIKQFGVELDSLYPYLGQDNECPIDPEEEPRHQDTRNLGYLKPQITAWQQFTSMADWYKWLRKSPLIVGVNVPADFAAYGGGVHSGLGCNQNTTHAMLLVGSGIQKGREFWLLKNSFSNNWGEQGYFKLSKSAPLRCFDSTIVARVKFPL